MKLPKQWKHWCGLMNLRPHYNQTRYAPRSYAWMYLKGRGRVWRLNDKGEFQCGDKLEDFDRWALCSIESVPMPLTQNEFITAVRMLELNKFISGG